MFQRIDLIPKPPLHVKLRKAALVIGGVLIMLGASIPLARYLMVKNEIHAIRDRVVHLEREAEEARALSVRADSLRKTVEKMKKEINAHEKEIAALTKKRRMVPDFRDALLEISSAMNGDIRLTHVSLNSMGGTLKGEAKQVEAVSTFLEALKNAHGPIDDAELMALLKDNDQAQAPYRFQVRVAIRPGGTH